MSEPNITADSIRSMESKQDKMMDLQVEQGKTLVAILAHLDHINSTIDINKKEQEETKKLAWSSREDIREVEFRVQTLETERDKRNDKEAMWQKPVITFSVKLLMGAALLAVISYGELLK